MGGWITLFGIIVLVSVPGIYAMWTMRDWDKWRIAAQKNGTVELSYNYRGVWCSHGMFENGNAAKDEIARLTMPVRINPNWPT